MTGLSALGIKELIGCQLCKSGYKSIFYFGDKLNSPNWHSLKLSLSLSREFQVFCCHDGKRKKIQQKTMERKEFTEQATGKLIDESAKVSYIHNSNALHAYVYVYITLTYL